MGLGHRTLQTLDRSTIEMAPAAPVPLLGSWEESRIISEYNFKKQNLEMIQNDMSQGFALFITGLIVFYLIGVALLMGKQMRKVWFDIEIEDPEEKRHEDKDEE